MLVLTLHPGQSFRIGNDVKIIYIANKNQEALLSIKAPRYIKFRKLDQQQ